MSVFGAGAQTVRDCCRHGQKAWHSDKSLVGAGPLERSWRPRETCHPPRLSHEVPWGAQGNLWPGPDKLLRRVLSEERGECYSPPPNCGFSRATPRCSSHTLNCRRCQPESQPSQSTDPHQPAFALGSPVGVSIEGLAGGGGVLLQSPTWGDESRPTTSPHEAQDIHADADTP